MKIKKLIKINEKFYSKAYRFFRGESIKLVVSYSRSFKGKWHDNNKKPVTFGYLKSEEHIFTARALVIGKHKFSLLVAN